MTTRFSRYRWVALLRSPLKIIVLLSLIGCGGGLAPEGPVNLPVPFAAALDSQSRVVVVDGLSSNSGLIPSQVKFQQSGSQCSGKSFTAFSSAGEDVGNCFYDETRIRDFTTNGEQSQFTMPICCKVDNGEIVEAGSANFIELPHVDPTIDLCSLLPPGESCEGAHLIRGAASGVISKGSGSFQTAVGLQSIEHRYAAVVKGQGASRRFINVIGGVWVLHRK